MRFFCLLLVLFPSFVICDEFVTLNGRVQDEAGTPMPGVSVRLSGSVTNEAVTNSEGRFSFSLPRKAAVKLSLLLDGFQPIETKLTLQSSMNLDFTMHPLKPSEMMIVTASRVNTPLLDSPSASSVLTAEKIEASPSQNYADLLRSLPGVNASQISTRVFRITTRQVASAARIPTELVLVDGRSMNIDLNGAPSWDTIPIDPSQIAKIEVVHGPASAVWGPNAQTGVVNIIAKSPRELAGTSVMFSAGLFNRDIEEEPQSNGHLFSTNFTYGEILSKRFSMKISGGYFDQSALARPSGTIPVDSERNTGGASYPLYENFDTVQPKFDVRLDQELQNGARINYSGGIAWTEGTGHSSAGPVLIDHGTYNGYAKVAYDHENLYARFISNRVNIPTSFLLVRDAAGEPVSSDYDSQDYNVEAGNSLLIGQGHLLSYGGAFRIASFDLTLAPDADRRDQIGGYLQDEFSLDRFRFVIGGRVDQFNVTGVIFSPRLAAVFHASSNQSIRASFSKAFRPPTLLENYQDLRVTSSVLDLGPFDPNFTGETFPIITRFHGNSELQEETTTALEFGYTGIFRENTTVGAAFYVNKNDHNIRNSTAGFYSAEHPPDGWPLSPDIFTDLSNRGIVFPSLLQFVNSGPIRYYGLELSLEHRYNSNFSFFTNYTYQSNPVALEAPNRFPEAQLYEPPGHLFNFGGDFAFNKYFSNANLQYVSDAFWTDVLNPRFWGPTDAFTMVNVSFGRRWNDGKITTSFNITNLFNQTIQQHVFGDIIKRTITAEFRITL